MSSSDSDSSIFKACANLRGYSFHISLFVTSTLLTTATQMFATLSRDDEGGYRYSKPSAVFLAELLKLIISTCMLAYEGIRRSISTQPPPTGQPRLIAADPLRQFALYLIPTGFHFANNNITFYVVQGISPATNLAVGQSKVLFTVTLLYVLLGRRFNAQQLIALATLVCALVIMAYEDDATHASPVPEVHVPAEGAVAPRPHALYASSSWALEQFQFIFTPPPYKISPFVAILLSTLIAFNGSLAGVYNEKLLKELDSSIHFQNMVAYVWGSLWNCSYMFIDGTSRDILQGGLLTGYNSSTLAYVIFAATMGISVSFIFKYQDNISRLMVVATSIGVTLIASIGGLGEDVSVGQMTCVMLIALTLLAYYDGTQKQKATENAEREREQMQMPGKEQTTLLRGIQSR